MAFSLAKQFSRLTTNTILKESCFMSFTFFLGVYFISGVKLFEQYFSHFIAVIHVVYIAILHFIRRVGGVAAASPATFIAVIRVVYTAILHFIRRAGGGTATAEAPAPVPVVEAESLLRGTSSQL